jgi:hypothetical protein
MNWRERILSDPLVLRGKPCVKGYPHPGGAHLGLPGRGTGHRGHPPGVPGPDGGGRGSVP